MIKQPELGRKIAELRKSKGLTQEELVFKCNLNVRTLQRIEAGEVEPRKYTVNLILEVLDARLYDSEKKSNLLKRLEQFYKYFIDLFNFKTNIMKKITVLGIMILLIALGVFTINTEVRAQKNSNSEINSSSEKLSNASKELYFTDFSCEGCFTEKGLMIGRDVKFTLNGVKVNIGLIALDESTGYFNVGVATGKLMKNKVELSIPEGALNGDFVKYTADKVDDSGNEIILKGNAKLTDSESGEGFEADEIHITKI